MKKADGTGMEGLRSSRPQRSEDDERLAKAGTPEGEEFCLKKISTPEVKKETAITVRFEVIAADGNVEYKEEKTITEYPLDRN